MIKAVVKCSLINSSNIFHQNFGGQRSKAYELMNSFDVVHIRIYYWHIFPPGENNRNGHVERKFWTLKKSTFIYTIFLLFGLIIKKFNAENQFCVSYIYIAARWTLSPGKVTPSLSTSPRSQLHTSMSHNMVMYQQLSCCWVNLKGWGEGVFVLRNLSISTKLVSRAPVKKIIGKSEWFSSKPDHLG